MKKRLLWAALNILLLLPLVLLIIGFATDNLSANPIRDIQLRTGLTAIDLLMLSLACTPVYILTGYSPVMRLRRPLGLYAFFYALLHLVNYIWIDYGFDFPVISKDLFEKRYALAGLVSFLLLLPLAVTSFFRFRQRLGKAWRKIQLLVYPAAIAAVVHYIWQTKIGILVPVIYGIILAVLFVIRLPVVRNYITDHASWLRRRVAPGTR
jgi:sulfoxide reductase heme-binding subunit YedZ